MKMYLITDNSDTLTGMRLAGITGVLVKNREEFYREFDIALGMEDVAVLIISEDLRLKYRDRIDAKAKDRGLPLIIDIPDRNNVGRRKDFIMSYVESAIGIKL